VTNQRPSDLYWRFLESAAASTACDWPVLQTATRFAGWAAIMQGGKRMVCLPQNGLPLFHRLPSNQSANLRSELLPSPTKYACAVSMDGASNSSTATPARYGVFTPSSLEFTFFGFSTVFQKRSKVPYSRRATHGTQLDNREPTHECYKKEAIGTHSKAAGPRTFCGVSGAALTAC